MPNSDTGIDDFYLVLTETRMDPSFSAEGDYDAGEVALGPTMNGETPFTLVPDDHPDSTIKGTIVANQNSQIVAVTLRDIPLDDGQTYRTVYYCRFDEPMTEPEAPERPVQASRTIATQTDETSDGSLSRTDRHP